MFRYLTSGESHGKGLLGIMEGIPAGLKIDTEFLNQEMKLRKAGKGRGKRQKIETDEVEFISGVRFKETIGSPIGLYVCDNKW